MRTIEELQRIIKERFNEQVKQGTPKYSAELKRETIDAINADHTMSFAQFAREVGFHQTTINGWKRELEGRITSRTTKHGVTGIRHAVTTKIDVAKQIVEYGRGITEVSKAMGISTGTIANWIKDYKDGRYNLENVTQISRKKFITSEVLMSQLDTMSASIENKKIEIREALEREYKEKLERIA